MVEGGRDELGSLGGKWSRDWRGRLLGGVGTRSREVGVGVEWGCCCCCWGMLWGSLLLEMMMVVEEEVD